MAWQGVLTRLHFGTFYELKTKWESDGLMGDGGKGEWSIRDPYQPMDRTTAHWGGGVELGTGGRPFEVMPSCICMKDWILGTPIY